MPARSLLARWFLGGGLLLGLSGLALWKVLALPLAFPPYLATAVLALVYGAFCLIPSRASRDEKS